MTLIYENELHQQNIVIKGSNNLTICEMLDLYKAMLLAIGYTQDTIEDGLKREKGKLHGNDQSSQQGFKLEQRNHGLY